METGENFSELFYMNKHLAPTENGTNVCLSFWIQGYCNKKCFRLHSKISTATEAAFAEFVVNCRTEEKRSRGFWGQGRGGRGVNSPLCQSHSSLPEPSPIYTATSPTRKPQNFLASKILHMKENLTEKKKKNIALYNYPSQVRQERNG